MSDSDPPSLWGDAQPAWADKALAERIRELTIERDSCAVLLREFAVSNPIEQDEINGPMCGWCGARQAYDKTLHTSECFWLRVQKRLEIKTR